MADRPQRSLAVRVFEALALFGARKPAFAVGIAIVLVIGAATLIPGLGISTSRSDLVSADNPTQKKTVAFYKRFGYPDDPVIIVTGDTPDNRRAFIDKLVPKLEKIAVKDTTGETVTLEGRVLARVTPETVAEVLLLRDPKATAAALKRLGPDADVARTLQGGLPAWLGGFAKQISNGLEGSTADEKETAAGLDQLTTLVHAFDDEVQGTPSDKRFASFAAAAQKDQPEGIDELGYLVGAGDYHVIALFPQIRGDEASDVAPLVNAIRDARDSTLKENPSFKIEADVTGVPALVTDERNIVQRDLALTGALSTIAIALSLYFAFRSIRQASVSFLPIGFGTIITMGAARLVFGRLNLITASFTSVLLGLGDFGVHIQARYAELLRNGVEKRKAMETALLKAGPGLVVGTFTTAVAFLTTTVTEFTAFAQLGLLTCIGLLVMLCGTYLLIAPMILLILGNKPRVPPEMPGMRALGRLIRKYPKGLVIGSVVITLAFIPFLWGVAFNPRSLRLSPEGGREREGPLPHREGSRPHADHRERHGRQHRGSADDRGVASRARFGRVCRDAFGPPPRDG